MYDLPVMVVHTCHPSTQEIEAGGWQVQGQKRRREGGSAMQQQGPCGSRTAAGRSSDHDKSIRDTLMYNIPVHKGKKRPLALP